MALYSTDKKSYEDPQVDDAEARPRGKFATFDPARARSLRFMPESNEPSWKPHSGDCRAASKNRRTSETRTETAQSK